MTRRSGGDRELGNLDRWALQVNRGTHPSGWTRSALPVQLGFVLLVTIKLMALVGAVDGTAFTGIKRVQLLTLATVGMVLCVAAPAFLMRGRRQLAALFVVDAILTLIVYTDLVYDRQFDAMPTLAMVRYAHQLVDVWSGIPPLLRASDLWIWADVALLLVLTIALPAAHRLRPISLGRVCVVGALGLAAFVAGIVASPDSHKPWLSSAIHTGSFGFMGFHAYDAYWAARRVWHRRLISPDLQAAALARVDSLAAEPHPATFGVAQGRNVIVIQVESLQEFTLGLRTPGGEVTPNLDALAREGIVVPDFYHQAGAGRTSDAEFAANCSLLPPGDIPAASEYADRVLDCLPRVLGKRGYHTYAFQTMAPDLWNAAAIERAMGFSRSYSARDFVMDERVGIGISDESLFRQMLTKLDSLPQPYYAVILTLTSHTPFTDPRLPPFDVGAIQGTTVGHYLRAVHYTDAAIGHFVEALRAKGILDRSVLVIYGDHDGVTRHKTPELPRLLKIPASDERAWFVAEHRIPLLIRLPHGEHAGMVPRFGGQIDIAPTLLALLGIPRAGTPFLGRDLLAPSAASDVVTFPGGYALTPDRLSVRVWSTTVSDRCYGRSGELPAERCRDLTRAALTEGRLSEALTDGGTLTRLAAPPGGTMARHGK
jgi:phosphoglycerol transferase MdoB-like AlkP superfamily enzyme